MKEVAEQRFVNTGIYNAGRAAPRQAFPIFKKIPALPVGGRAGLWSLGKSGRFQFA
jgi:hypothetical protein